MTRQLQFPLSIENVVDPAGGERAKADGMATAAANTAPSWATACRAAIAVMARRGIEFQAADLITEGIVDEPDHPNRWGPAFLGAARAGLIQPAGYARSKRTTVHSSICRTWIGTNPAETEAAA